MFSVWIYIKLNLVSSHFQWSICVCVWRGEGDRDMGSVKIYKVAQKKIFWNNSPYLVCPSDWLWSCLLGGHRWFQTHQCNLERRVKWINMKVLMLFTCSNKTIHWQPGSLCVIFIENLAANQTFLENVSLQYRVSSWRSKSERWLLSLGGSAPAFYPSFQHYRSTSERRLTRSCAPLWQLAKAEKQVQNSNVKCFKEMLSCLQFFGFRWLRSWGVQWMGNNKFVSVYGTVKVQFRNWSWKWRNSDSSVFKMNRAPKA